MTELTEMAVQIARIDENVEDMKHRLFGNGQPGELETLKSRTTALEQTQSYARGVVRAFWTIIALATSGGLIELIRQLR